MKNTIIAHNGSIQNVPGIPDELKRIYKTVWEISQKTVIDLSADRVSLNPPMLFVSLFAVTDSPIYIETGCFHRSKSILEHSSLKSYHGSTYFDALLRMEEGTQDWNGELTRSIPYSPL